MFADTKLCTDSIDMASGFQELTSFEKSLFYTRLYLLMFLYINKHSLGHLFGISFTIPSKWTVWSSDQYKLIIMSSHPGPIWALPSVWNQYGREREFGLQTTVYLGGLISILEKWIFTIGKPSFLKCAQI